MAVLLRRILSQLNLDERIDDLDVALIKGRIRLVGRCRDGERKRGREGSERERVVV